MFSNPRVPAFAAEYSRQLLVARVVHPVRLPEPPVRQVADEDPAADTGGAAMEPAPGTACALQDASAPRGDDNLMPGNPFPNIFSLAAGPSRAFMHPWERSPSSGTG